MQFKHATKEQAKLRMAIIGPAGSGKTYTALAVATGLGGKIAVIDTEHGSASKYADLFAFDTLQLESFSPQNYVLALQAAQEGGYDVIIIDSLSHEWNGKGGALEMVDQSAARSGSGNTYTAWRDVTPQHNKLTDAIIGAKAHVIATLRSKTEYVIEQNEKGKMVPRKVGMGPIQRDGMEYEFDVVGEMNMKNSCSITKTRCPELVDLYLEKPGANLSKLLKAWLTTGAKPVEKPVAPAPVAATPPAAPPKASETAPAAPPPSPGVTDETFTIKGVIENAIAKGEKFGVKIMGKKQYYVTFSQPAFVRALDLKGTKVALTYTVKQIDGKMQYNLQGIKKEEVNV